MPTIEESSERVVQKMKELAIERAKYFKGSPSDWVAPEHTASTIANLLRRDSESCHFRNVAAAQPVFDFAIQSGDLLQGSTPRRFRIAEKHYPDESEIGSYHRAREEQRRREEEELANSLAEVRSLQESLRILAKNQCAIMEELKYNRGRVNDINKYTGIMLAKVENTQKTIEELERKIAPQFPDFDLPTSDRFKTK